MKNSSPQMVFGSFEPVVLPAFSPDTFIAKVDTGAYSGAIHCSLLKEVEREGYKVLRFRPLRCKKTLTTQEYSVRYVRSSTGHRVRRYLIDTQIIVNGQEYDITIGLSNRADMQYDILIGRRFLRDKGIMVDVRINQGLDKDLKEEVA